MNDAASRRRSAERLRTAIVVGGVVGALVLALCAVGVWLALRPAGGNLPDPFAVGAPSEPPPTFDRAAALELRAEWESNEVVAARKYIGRRYRLRGRVSTVQAPDVAHLTVEDAGTVPVRMRGRQVERLRAGDAVVIDATLATHSLLGDTFSGGSLVE